MVLNSDYLALKLIQRYKSDWDKGNPELDSEVTSEEESMEYALLQIRKKTKSGIGIDVYGKKVLEIGCGHGGICLFASMNGAETVYGIDISDGALAVAEKIKTHFVNKNLVREKDLNFLKTTAEKLEFPDEYFDIVIADNVFEHVSDLKATLSECKRVLKKGGIIHAPNFPSIYSKYGPHLKYGTKIPWLHVFFTEKAICRALYKRAVNQPELKLFDWYKGLSNKPETFRDVREYKDLNYITHKKFKAAVKANDLKIVNFYPKRTITQKILVKLFPFLKKTIVDDIFSSTTLATLKK